MRYNTQNQKERGCSTYIMKRSNGMGSVYKVSGNRRKPYVSRVTKGFDNEGKQIYEYLGTFSTQKEAENILNEYTKNPYNLNNLHITFRGVYELWKQEKYPKIREGTAKAYDTSFNKYCKDLWDIRFVDLRVKNYQDVIDNSNCNYPTRNKIRNFISQISKYAQKNDIVQKDYSQFIDIGKGGHTTKRKPFTNEDINKLWNNVNEFKWVDSVLILLYSGMRICEMLDLEIQNIHLDEEYPYMVGGCKTDAGRDRCIPIHNRILPLIKNYYEKNKDRKYLITNHNGDQMDYYNYRRNKWDVIMKDFEMDFTPHCTRHTFISLLRSKKADPLNIKRIVGHISNDVTDDVYTHIDIKELWETTNLVD